jgi:hypothetical protein
LGTSLHRSSCEPATEDEKVREHEKEKNERDRNIAKGTPYVMAMEINEKLLLGMFPDSAYSSFWKK